MNTVELEVDRDTRSLTVVWIQRAIVAGIWVAAIVSWQLYQSSNGLSTTETAQRFNDTVGGSSWGIFAFVLVYLARPIVLFPASADCSDAPPARATSTTRTKPCRSSADSRTACTTTASRPC